ncbi:hypothetical protein GCM10027061_09010 [Nesterenkonia suensis]
MQVQHGRPRDACLRRGVVSRARGVPRRDREALTVIAHQSGADRPLFVLAERQSAPYTAGEDIGDPLTGGGVVEQLVDRLTAAVVAMRHGPIVEGPTGEDLRGRPSLILADPR